MSLWAALGDDTEHAIITPDQAHQIALVGHSRLIDHCIRWINHYQNRLTYERAMLDDQGGLAAEKFDIQPGGMVLTGDEWSTVIRVNRANGSNGLHLGRDAQKALSDVKELGDRSAHNRRYNAVKADLEKIQSGVRVAVDEMIALAELRRRTA